MYHIAICDNDKNFRNSLKKTILRSGISKDESIFYEFDLGKDMIEKLKKVEFCDLLFLERKMDDLDGYEAAKDFRGLFESSVLVLCSVNCPPSDKCFKVTPYRYLYKDYSDAKMLNEIREIVEKVKKNKNEDFYVIGNYYYNIIRINSKDILYIENSKHGSSIHVCNEKIEYEFEKKLKTKYKLAKLYEKLNKYGFEYGHNSYLINLKYVAKMLSKGEVKLTDGTILSISRSKFKKFRNSLLKEIDNF